MPCSFMDCAKYPIFSSSKFFLGCSLLGFIKFIDIVFILSLFSWDFSGINAPNPFPNADFYSTLYPPFIVFL